MQVHACELGQALACCHAWNVNVAPTLRARALGDEIFDRGVRSQVRSLPPSYDVGI